MKCLLGLITAALLLTVCGPASSLEPTPVPDIPIFTEGQAIALLDGELVAAADTVPDAVQELFRRAAPDAGSLVTLYWGGEASEQEAQGQAAWLGSHYPEVEVEVVQGGQPHYRYLISLE